MSGGSSWSSAISAGPSPPCPFVALAAWPEGADAAENGENGKPTRGGPPSCPQRSCPLHTSLQRVGDQSADRALQNVRWPLEALLPAGFSWSWKVVRCQDAPWGGVRGGELRLWPAVKSRGLTPRASRSSVPGETHQSQWSLPVSAGWPHLDGSLRREPEQERPATLLASQRPGGDHNTCLLLSNQCVSE